MNVVIRIDYVASGNKAYQAGSFPLGGRKVDQVAFDFWKQIKKEMSYRAKIEKITANGEEITQLGKVLEDNEWLKRNREMDDLPF
jgi:hypothetical protein